MASTYPTTLDSLTTTFADASATKGVHAAHHDDVGDAVNKLERAHGRVFGVDVYGGAGDGVTDSTAAINLALTAAAAGGGRVLFGPGTYVTTGNHVIGDNVQVVGHGMGTTVIRHTGNNACFTHRQSGGPSGWMSSAIRDLSFRGTSADGTTDNTGAGAGAIYLEDVYGFLIENVAVGWQIGVATKGLYTNGFALWMKSVSATYGFVEGITIRNFRSLYNKTGIRMTRTPGTFSASFGNQLWQDFRINVPANGTGIDCDSTGSVLTRLYNSELRGGIWMNFNGGVGVDVGAFFQVEASTFADLRGECYAPTCTWIKNRGGVFTPNGIVTLETDGSATNNLASGTTKLDPPGTQKYASVIGTGGTTTNVTATTSGTATTVFAGASTLYDNNTLKISFCLSAAQRGTNTITFGLFRDGTLIKNMAIVNFSPWVPVGAFHEDVPTAGTHTYSIRAWVDAGTGVFQQDGTFTVQVV